MSDATPRVLRVTRTGGFAGLSRTGELDLDADDERSREADALVGGLDVEGVQSLGALPTTGADRYSYAFELSGPSGASGASGVRAASFTVAEQHLPEDLRRLGELVLDA